VLNSLSGQEILTVTQKQDPFAQRAAAAAQRNILSAALSGSDNAVGVGGGGGNASTVGASVTAGKAGAAGRR